MGSVLRGFVGLALLALPSAAVAHGSNVLDASDPHHEAHDAAAAAHDHHSPGTLAAEIDDIHDDVDQLLDKLQAHDERARLTDIVGGIGYIVGITGIAFYFLGARRKKDAASPCGQ